VAVLQWLNKVVRWRPPVPTAHAAPNDDAQHPSSPVPVPGPEPVLVPAPETVAVPLAINWVAFFHVVRLLWFGLPDAAVTDAVCIARQYAYIVHGRSLTRGVQAVRAAVERLAVGVASACTSRVLIRSALLSLQHRIEMPTDEAAYVLAEPDASLSIEEAAA
jgi:hypothetical protein